MRHSVAVYNVTVTELGDPSAYRMLGDVDEQGTPLAKVIQPAFAKAKDHLADDSDLRIEYVCDLPGLTPLQAGVVLLRGEDGVSSDLDLDNGPATRRRHNIENVRVACLVTCASGTHQSGHFAVYIPSARGITTPVRAALVEMFRAKYNDLILRIEPVVPRALVRKAIEQDGIHQVEYVAWKKPADKFPDATEWIPAENLGRVRTIVTPKRGSRVRPSEVEKWANAEGSVAELLVFQNQTYDEVKIVVEVDGRRHTVNLRDPTGGRTSEVDVEEPEEGDDGRPTPEGLKRALLDGIAAVTASA